MGASGLLNTLPGGLNIDAVKRHFEGWREEDGHESGHGSYAGNWTTFSGLEFKSTVFKDYKAAEEYIYDYAEKWGPAVAVRFNHVKVELVSTPTFNGEEPGYMGEGRACYKLVHAPTTWVPADQLTEPQKARCLKLLAERALALNAARKSADEFNDLITKLQSDPEWWNAAALKKVRTAYFKAKAKAEKAKATLAEFNQKMCQKLYKEKASESTTQWLVGGWAAS